MTTQSLFGEVHSPAGRPSIEERFESFHRANPWVLDRLVELAYHYRAQARRVAIKALVEQVRAENGQAIKQTGDFKIDNSLTSRYARKIMAEHPDLDGAFAVRGLRS